jgi:cardiolipin synthase
VAAISDGVDGYIARRYNQISELGKMIDPLADKLLLVSAMLLLTLKNEQLPRIPIWLTATILSRDAILIMGLLLIQHVCGKANVRPIMIGKVATCPPDDLRAVDSHETLTANPFPPRHCRGGVHGCVRSHLRA